MKSYSSGEVAQICDVSPRTVIRWIAAHRLKAFKLPGRGNNRVAQVDLVTFLKASGIPVPLGLLHDDEKQCVVLSKDKHFVRHVKRLALDANYLVQTIGSEIEAGFALAKVPCDLVVIDEQALTQAANTVVKLIQSSLPQTANIVIFYENATPCSSTAVDVMWLEKPLDLHQFSGMLEDLNQ